MENRKDILLRAAYDLLRKASEMHYVQEATHITVFYDDADCDGYCLMEDIATELDLDDLEEPLSRTRAQQREIDNRTSQEIDERKEENDVDTTHTE